MVSKPTLELANSTASGCEARVSTVSPSSVCNKCCFSVLILTRNEEINIADCIQSVAWCDDVVVLDSLSTDRTVEIAQRTGARVFQRAFDDFASQRNFALDTIAFKHPWLFHLDADERFTEPLLTECNSAAFGDSHSGYLVPNKLIYNGKWLRRTGLYPSYQMRLLKLGEIRFIQKGHGQREDQATRGIGMLRQPYLHYNFSKGMVEWIARHNEYSTSEARDALKELEHGKIDWRSILCCDDTRRRRALKQLSIRMPFRPFLKFIYMYFLRGGFLDGSAGLDYSLMMAMYEQMIVLKMKEIKQTD